MANDQSHQSTQESRTLLWKIAAFVLILALGAIGFELGCAGWQIDDSIYRSLQLFFLNYENELVCGLQENWLLRVARIAAAILVAYAVLSLAGQRVSDIWRSLLHRSRHKYVLLGYGRVNRVLADRLKSPTASIVVVDLAFSESERRQLRRAGLRPIECDLTDFDAVQALELSSARKVFVACGDDTVNLKIGSLALRAFATEPASKDKKPVHVHIASPKFRQELGDAADVSIAIDEGLEFFSIKKATATALVARLRLAERARDHGMRRPHVVLIGCGELAEAIFLEALNSTVSDDKSTAFTFIDSDPTTEARFRARYPQLFDDSLPPSARLAANFLVRDITLIDFDNDPELAELEAKPDPPTCWIMACRDDEPNIEAALRLETAMHALRRRPVPVFSRVWRGDIALKPHTTLGPSLFFGNQNDALVANALLSEDRDWFAKLIHEGYKKDRAVAEPDDDTNPDTRAANSDWEDIPVSNRVSSRLAAEHVPQKLWDLGYDWRDRQTGLLPLAPRDTDLTEQLRRDLTFFRHAGRNEALPESLILHARTEHLRWLLDRALNGFRAGKTRNNRRRIHPDMVTFGRLKRARKRLDLTAVREGLLLSDREGNGQRAGRARARLSQAIEAKFAKTAVLGEAITELAVHLRSEDGGYDMDVKSALAELIVRFGELPTSCRLHFVIHGEGLIKVEVSPGKHLDNSRNVKFWLAGACAKLPEGVIVDVTWLPE